jgi:hypothetical protein
MGDELVSVLKEISSELKGIKVRLDESEIAVRDMQGVVAECFDKVTDLHSRLIREANKIGTQVNQHQRVIQSHEGRIGKLERAGANGAA